MTQPKLKVCSRCKKQKPVSAFNARKKAYDGLRASCRDCDRATRQAWEARQDQTQSQTAPKKIKQTPSRPPGVVEGAGPSASAPAEGPAPDTKVIGRIGDSPRISETTYDADAEERRIQQEYASLLNRKLPIRRRAALLVQIAKNVEGSNAALALQAIKDINKATKVVTDKGVQVDMAPMFVMPEGTPDIKVK